MLSNNQKGKKASRNRLSNTVWECSTSWSVASLPIRCAIEPSYYIYILSNINPSRGSLRQVVAGLCPEKSALRCGRLSWDVRNIVSCFVSGFNKMSETVRFWLFRIQTTMCVHVVIGVLSRTARCAFRLIEHRAQVSRNTVHTAVPGLLASAPHRPFVWLMPFQSNYHKLWRSDKINFLLLNVNGMIL